MKRKVKLTDIDRMLGLYSSKVLRLPSIEVMEERISDGWAEQGYSLGEIDAALEYAKSITRIRLEYLPVQVRTTYERRAYRWSLREATVWLRGVHAARTTDLSSGETPYA